MIAVILFAMLATEAGGTAPSVLPVLYGPSVSMHVGATGAAPWRISTAAAVKAARFDWSIDMERRQQRAQFGDLTMAYERSRRRLTGAALAGRPRRSAAWQASATLRLAGMDGHPLAIEGKIQQERRAPAAASDRGRMQQIRTQGINLMWYPTGSLTIGGGWQSQGSPARRRGIDRAIDIASGNPISEAGPKLQLGLDSKTDSDARTAWHLGLDAGAYRITSRDLAVLGSPNPLDERITLSLRVSLR